MCVLLTTDGGDPVALGTLPPNVHVELWCNDTEVLPQVAAMVGNGCLGSTLRGLAAGVPMVRVPLVADQGYTAQRDHAAGPGLALANEPRDLHELAVAVARVVAETSFRAAAQRVAGEMRALPDVAEAVPLIAELARSGR
jgi:UDP:flavonoid glycosyltransferase YjiC (YdhE family)